MSDSFVIAGMFHYMGDVFSRFGDEGEVLPNAESVGQLASSHSTGQAVDWSGDRITCAPGQVNPHTQEAHQDKCIMRMVGPASPGG